MVETVYTIPGLGRYLVQSVQNLSFIRKLTSHAILTFIPFELAVFSGRNLHTRAHGGSQGDAL